MKASNCSDAQKAFILKQGDGGVPVAEFVGRQELARRPIFIGARNMRGLLPDEMHRLKALEGESKPSEEDRC